jgi:hypothetical protein
MLIESKPAWWDTIPTHVTCGWDYSIVLPFLSSVGQVVLSSMEMDGTVSQGLPEDRLISARRQLLQLLDNFMLGILVYIG